MRLLTLKYSLPLLALCFSPLSTAQDSNSGAQIWDLSPIYASDSAWELALDQLNSDIAKLENLQDSLDQSASDFGAALNSLSQVDQRVARVYVYASLIRDTDQRDPVAQQQFGKARQMLSNYESARAWLNPAILAMGETRVRQFLSENDQLAKFKFQLEDILRKAPHTLDQATEAILAQASLLLSSPEQIYENFANADIPWPVVTLSTGEEVTLNQAGYSRWRGTANRADRKLVFDTFWDTWNQYGDGMGAILATEVQANVFIAKSRNYEGVLESNLFNDGLPGEVYTQLVTQVNDALPIFHRYLKLRGRMLEIDDLRYYDIYPPLVELDTGGFDIERSKQISLQALAPFGANYLALLEEGLSQQWMHSHPQPGKRSGAYMNGSIYDAHPYVLLNHNDDYDSLSTFAHEWGHAVHTQLANANNSWENASYSTFTAEMASTINEILLEEYMIANASSDAEVLFYLGSALESIRGTLFRQTMFAEFELAIHQAAENGQALTGPIMSDIYGDLLKRYHGHDEGVLTIDAEYAIEWAYIPHFYYDFYVFQYATSITGAAWFAEQFLAGDEAVRDDFMRVLSAGGSDYAYNILLNEAGLDMASAEAYQPVLRRMSSLMDRIEVLLD
ncbi:MAG: oligoendopeptidase F [SAR86 cluster bacterium]|uniref:Oligopeptidase F n=1 Tax=SAR86 cluster bacterium TaxID=2030880 RepID=A0A2A4MKX0_9GAMM|nr:MAG: oligoendopeptidase F [SAR86 cluster bacterium]